MSAKLLAGCAVTVCAIQAYEMAGIAGVIGAALCGVILFRLFWSLMATRADG